MKDYFKNRHGEANVSGQNVESLKAKRIRFESQGTLLKLGFVSASKTLLIAFNHLVYNVAKSKKSHKIAEELIKPCVLQMKKKI